MNKLEQRVEKLEQTTGVMDKETIMHIVFVAPEGQEITEEQRKAYPPVDEQIAAGRAAGKKVFKVYSYAAVSHKSPHDSEFSYLTKEK